MRECSGFLLPDNAGHVEDYLRRFGGVYQAVQRRRSLEYVTGWECAVDVGAHVGLWSRELVERFRRVIAFEPMAEHREFLARNVPSGRLVIVPVALGNSVGTVSLETQGGLVLAHHQGAFPDMAPLAKLDDFHLSRLDYLKIDTDGFDLEVLQGAEQTLRRHMPIVVVEEKFVGQRRFDQPRYAVIRFLEQIGARVLERVGDDFVLGWNDVPGKVRQGVEMPVGQWLDAAIARHAKGDFEGALIDYQYLLRQQPDNAQLLTLTAAAVSQSGDRLHGINLAQRATKCDGEFLNAFVVLGVLLKDAGRLEEAAAVLTAAAAKHPGDVQVRRQLVAVLQRRGKLDEAGVQLRRLLEIAPNALDTPEQQLTLFIDPAHQRVPPPAVHSRHAVPSRHPQSDVTG